METKLESGISVTVEGVPCQRDRVSGDIFFDPAEALRLYFTNEAKKAGLTEARDLATLVMLVSPVYESIEATQIPYQYHVNKMLFYQWKRLDEIGLGDAFPHDEFVADRKGPVPRNIKSDLQRLESEGLIRIRWPSGPVHQPVPVELTRKGQRIAAALHGASDDWLRKVSADAKTELITLSPASLMDKVHREFPELRRDYVEIDKA